MEATARNENHSSDRVGAKARLVGVWLAQIVAAGVLAMAAVTKFTTGSPELADGLGVATGLVMAIGAVELLAALLLVIPRLHFFGAGLAAGTMIGALVSHATTLGFSGDVGGMWPLAAVVLVAALAVLWMRRGEALRFLNRRKAA